MADEREIGSFETCERCGRERGIVGDRCDADWSGTPTPDIYSDGERLAGWHWSRSDCEKLQRIRELEAERDRFCDKFIEKEEETYEVQELMGGFEGQDATPSMVKTILDKLRAAEAARNEWRDFVIEGKAIDGAELRLAEAIRRAEAAEKALAEVDMILNVVGADRDFRRKLLCATRDRLEAAEARRDRFQRIGVAVIASGITLPWLQEITRFLRNSRASLSLSGPSYENAHAQEIALYEALIGAFREDGR